MNDHPLPRHAAIDSYLAGARETLTAQLAAGLDLDAGLDAIFGHGEEPPEGRQVTTEPVDSAGWAIWIRQRARDQSADLVRFSRSFSQFCANTRHGQQSFRAMAADKHRWLRGLSWRQQRATDLWRDMGHNEDLCHSAFEAVSFLTTILYTVEAEMSQLLAAASFVRSRDSSAAEALNQQAAAVAQYLHYAATFARQVWANVVMTEVDASRADLSSLPPIDVSLLAGVVWTDATVWPAGTDRGLLRGCSAEIAPGVYRVAGGNERDHSDLVIR